MFDSSSSSMLSQQWTRDWTVHESETQKLLPTYHPNRSRYLLEYVAAGLWRIVLLKVAYYATSSARNFAKLCQNYARIPKLCFWFSKLCSQNEVDSVHIGAQKRHQSIMFFKYVVVGNLYVFYGSLSRPSAVQTAHAEFVKRGLVTKHVRTNSILLLAKLKHAL